MSVCVVDGLEGVHPSLPHGSILKLQAACRKCSECWHSVSVLSRSVSVSAGLGVGRLLDTMGHLGTRKYDRMLWRHRNDASPGEKRKVGVHAHRHNLHTF